MLLSMEAVILTDDQIEFFLFSLTTQCGYTPFQTLKIISTIFSGADKARVNQPKKTVKNDELVKNLNKWLGARNETWKMLMVLFQGIFDTAEVSGHCSSNWAEVFCKRG